MAEKNTTVVKKHGVKLHVTCKVKDGEDLRCSDKGFDECIKKVKNGKKNSKNPKEKVNAKFENKI